MPPRKRRPKNTPENPIEAQEENEMTSTEEIAQPVEDYEFGSVTDAPEIPAQTIKRKPRGAAPVPVLVSDGFAVVGKQDMDISAKRRPRDNPYDDAVKQSYQENLEASDQWLQFTTLADAVTDQERLIRSAAQYHEVGCRIRVSDKRYNEDGEAIVDVYFRGQSKKARARKTVDAGE